MSELAPNFIIVSKGELFTTVLLVFETTSRRSKRKGRARDYGLFSAIVT